MPLFAKTGGNYSISANLDTRLDSQMSPILNSLTAKGSLQSKNIEIQNLEVFDLLANLLKNDKLRKVEAKDIDIRFAITDGRVQTSPFDLKIGNTKLTLSGSTGLDQSIDYTALIDLSKEKVISDYVGIVEARIGGTLRQTDHRHRHRIARETGRHQQGLSRPLPEKAPLKSRWPTSDRKPKRPGAFW